LQDAEITHQKIAFIAALDFFNSENRQPSDGGGGERTNGRRIVGSRIPLQ
jgi:hypothetical protein